MQQPNYTFTPAQKIFIAFCRNMEVPENLFLAILALCSDKALAEIIFWATKIHKTTGKLPTKSELHHKLMEEALKARHESK